MKSIKTIKDPKVFELLADDTRRRIIYLLRAKEMTVSQIASELGFTAQAIYHHIRKLKAAGLVEVSREERVGHFIETYYRSAAEIFMLSHGELRSKQSYEELARSTIDGLVKLGLMTPAEPAVVSKVAKLMKAAATCCDDGKWSDRIGEMGDVGFFTKQSMLEIAHLLTEDDEQYEERIGIQKELRDLLRSCCLPESKPRQKKK